MRLRLCPFSFLAPERARDGLTAKLGCLNGHRGTGNSCIAGDSLASLERPHLPHTREVP